jgi:hypothetical protein
MSNPNPTDSFNNKGTPMPCLPSSMMSSAHREANLPLLLLVTHPHGERSAALVYFSSLFLDKCTASSTTRPAGPSCSSCSQLHPQCALQDWSITYTPPTGDAATRVSPPLLLPHYCGTGEFPTAPALRPASQLLFAKADCMTVTSGFAALDGLLDLGVGPHRGC